MAKRAKDKERRKKILARRETSKEGPPKFDPNKRATQGQLLGIAQEQHNLRQQISKDLSRLWGNDQEMMKGIQAAEYNLRTHQKVINDLVVENLKLQKLLISLTHGADFQVEDPHNLVGREMEEGLIMKEVDGVDGKELKVDWSQYHQFVDADLAEIAEQEAKAKVEAEASQAAAKMEADKIAAEAPYQAQPKEVEVKEMVAHPEFPEGATIFGG